MNVKEAASVLGVHPNTVYAWIEGGRLPAEKKHVSWDISEDEVKAMMNVQAAESAKSAYMFFAHEAMRKELKRQKQTYLEGTLRYQAAALIRAIDEKGDTDTAVGRLSAAIQQFKAIESAFDIVDTTKLWESDEKGHIVDENEEDGV